MEVKKIPICSSDTRSNGLQKFDLSKLHFPSGFIFTEQILISLPPKQLGGNHKHPREEFFIALDEDLELHWVDKDGKSHILKMRDENLYLFQIPANVPHAIINTSKIRAGLLMEFASEPLRDPEAYPVILKE